MPTWLLSQTRNGALPAPERCPAFIINWPPTPGGRFIWSRSSGIARAVPMDIFETGGEYLAIRVISSVVEHNLVQRD